MPMSRQYLLSYIYILNHNMLKVVDQGWNELLGGEGVKIVISEFTFKLQIFQRFIIGIHLTGIFILILLIL
jgi:hypothetical protein